jgi:hypothetical protein
MNFQRIYSAPWIDEAQKQLPFEIPKCFSDFVRNYSFTDFEINHLHHYDNYDGSDRWCWHVALTLDLPIFDICKLNRFLPIGQPEQSNYDRICLDINRLKDGDCPIVQLNHEMILLWDRIEIVAELAPSYKKLISNVLSAYNYLDGTDPSTSSG